MSQREVLAGSVLDLHNRGATDAEYEHLVRTQRELRETALRLKDQHDEAVQLLRRTLELREIGDEGWHKTDIRAFLARIGEPVFITRFARQQALERAISAFNADPREAIELIHALQGALRERFDDKVVDVDDALGTACSALEELE